MLGNKKRVLTLVVILVFLITFFAGGWFYGSHSIKLEDVSNSHESSKEKPENSIIDEKAEIDINGNGEKELIYVLPKEPLISQKAEKKVDFRVEILAVTKDGQEIARTPKDFTFLAYSKFPEKIQSYRFDTNDKKECIELTTSASRWHFITYFLCLIDGELVPICGGEAWNKGPVTNCGFYNEDGSKVMVEDLNGDGITEVIEISKWYWSEDSKHLLPCMPGEKRDDAFKMPQIFSFRGDYFEAQTNKAYDKFFEILKQDHPDLVSATGDKRKPNKTQHSLPF